ncbi:MAG: HAD family phosphatase [Simkaniaceae bacterium]|nr:HAD family phosphatase [Simkaniaceae bacterium]
MSWILDYSPIFFDFDGLLVNTEHLHFQAYQRMLERNNHSFPWDFPSFAAVAHTSSEGLRRLITSHAPALVASKSWETLYAEKKGEYAKLLETGSLDLMPGAQVILETMQMAKIPHAVVTNSTRQQTEMIGEKIPILNHIPYWITREDYKNPKPSPDAYLKAIKVLGPSKKMLGFEDSLRGIRALERAAITPVLICPLDHPQMVDVSKNTLHYYPSLTALFG